MFKPAVRAVSPDRDKAIECGNRTARRLA